MADGLVQPRTQGGPLSPMPSSLPLTDLDRKLERRGDTFCRYADDCNIYVASERAGRELLQHLTGFLGELLKLTVNVPRPRWHGHGSRRFRGYSMTWYPEPRLRVAATSVERLTVKMKLLLRGARGRNLGATIRRSTPSCAVG